MAAYASLLLAYLLGGLTFLPLVVAAIFLHAHLTLPTKTKPSAHDTADHSRNTETEQAFSDVREKLEQASSEPSVAASYFAVCREYVPGGINGKPPERTTPAGETIAAESPSVYQSMYRSIFDRKKTQVPSMDAGKTIKQARNVFYVVLRHDHLLLFNNENQVEVRHVIPLTHYKVDIYAGGEDIPEGELFIKRNCIRLMRKTTDDNSLTSTPSMPYFLFSDNCSEKEDFYHALLHNIENKADGETATPVVQHYETEDMIKLIRQLHTTDDTSHTRWINALIGRVFLAIYKTEDVENFIRKKVMKKISRVPKPSFITSLRLEDVSLGDSAPQLINPKLREMNVDGGLMLETDVKYTGSFKLVIAATARIDLGSRFKAREVNFVLASVLRKLEGHLLIRIKPPPSNRLWISFESIPKMDLSVEPIVSSRQITYGVILRAIESRIREVVGETLVSPNWDDTPFFNTEEHKFRGGIWKTKKHHMPGADQELVTEESKVSAEVSGGVEESVPPVASPPSPEIVGTDFPSAEVPQRVNSLPPNFDSQVDRFDENSLGSSPTSPKLGPERGKPSFLRSNSFATAAQPIVSKTPSVVESMRSSSRSISKDAASAMKILHERSPEASPVGSPQSSLPKDLSIRPSRSSSVVSNNNVGVPVSGGREDDELMMPFAPDDLSSDQQTAEHDMSSDADASFSSSLGSGPLTPRHAKTPSTSSTSSNKRASLNAQLNAQLNSATIAAKNWGWGVFKQAQAQAQSSTTPTRLPRASNQPIGRGQPLPPPGVPLPKPQPETWSAATMNAFRRKPVPGTMTTAEKRASTSSLPRPSAKESSSSESIHGKSSSVSVTPPVVNGQIPNDELLLMQQSPTMVESDETFLQQPHETPTITTAPPAAAIAAALAATLKRHEIQNEASKESKIARLAASKSSSNKPKSKSASPSPSPTPKHEIINNTDRQNNDHNHNDESVILDLEVQEQAQELERSKGSEALME